MGPLVPNKRVKFHVPSLNRSREIPPKAVGNGIFDFFPYNFRPEVDNVGVDVAIKFGDIQAAISSGANERTLANPIPIARNVLGISP